MVQVYQPNAKRKVKPQCYTRWGWILGGGGVGALKRQKRKALYNAKTYNPQWRYYNTTVMNFY